MVNRDILLWKSLGWLRIGWLRTARLLDGTGETSGGTNIIVIIGVMVGIAGALGGVGVIIFLKNILIPIK